MFGNTKDPKHPKYVRRAQMILFLVSNRTPASSKSSIEVKVEPVTENRKRKREKPVVTDKKHGKITKKPPNEIRYDRTDHLPAVRENKSRNKCRLEGCKLKTNNYCIKCHMYLCIKEKNNCFVAFHRPNSFSK